MEGQASGQTDMQPSMEPEQGEAVQLRLRGRTDAPAFTLITAVASTSHANQSHQPQKRASSMKQNIQERKLFRSVRVFEGFPENPPSRMKIDFR
jgi:hypothetical protein